MFLRKSLDNGATWSAAQLIPDVGDRYGEFPTCYLSYQEFGINAEPTIPYRGTHAGKFFGTAQTDGIEYPSWAGLDGVTDASVMFRVRMYQMLGVGAFFSRYATSSNRQIRLYYTAGDVLWLGISTVVVVLWCLP